MGDGEVVHDLREVALDVDIADQPARKMSVRSYAQTGPGRACCGGGSASEHREVDDRQRRGVRHRVDELFRVEQPALGVFPTREPLVPDERPRVQVDDRLEMRPDLTMTDGDRELVGEPGHAHVGAVGDHHLSAAQCLRTVHRGVGAPHQLFRRILGGANGNTEAGRGRHRIRARLDLRTAYHLAQTLGDQRREIALVESVDHHDEFVTPQPRDGVAGTQTSRQRPSESPQHVVADRVTKGVVDVLQSIHVGEDHGDPAPVASRVRERDTHAGFEDRSSR